MHVHFPRLSVNQVRILSNTLFLVTLLLLMVISTSLRADDHKNKLKAVYTSTPPSFSKALMSIGNENIALEWQDQKELQRSMTEAKTLELAPFLFECNRQK